MDILLKKLICISLLDLSGFHNMCWLKNALYGLKRAHHAWFKHLSTCVQTKCSRFYIPRLTVSYWLCLSPIGSWCCLFTGRIPSFSNQVLLWYESKSQIDRSKAYSSCHWDKSKPLYYRWHSSFKSHSVASSSQKFSLSYHQQIRYCLCSSCG